MLISEICFIFFLGNKLIGNKGATLNQQNYLLNKLTDWLKFSRFNFNNWVVYNIIHVLKLVVFFSFHSISSIPLSSISYSEHQQINERFCWETSLGKLWRHTFTLIQDSRIKQIKHPIPSRIGGIKARHLYKLIFYKMTRYGQGSV